MIPFAFRAICASFFCVALVACGAPSTTDGGTDVIADATSDSTLDAPRDIAIDRGTDVAPDEVAADAPNDVPGDLATDAPADVATDTSPLCSLTTPCHAFWCGCGSCNPADIVCVSDSRGCPLGCVSSCPQVDTTVCSCTGGACSVVSVDAGTDAATDAHADASADATPDAGADASTDAGGAGTPCSGTGDCASGLLCCYPCGIPGCTNVCTAPMGGHCPLLP